MSRPDIVLVTVDSMRADSAGFLNDGALETPAMEAFRG